MPETTTFSIHRLSPTAAHDAIPALADVLIDCVEGGASVSFMWPLSREKAEAFWARVADSVARGETILLVAQDADGTILGTVQVVVSLPENQPHRGDVAKMLVHRRARRRGIAGALMEAAEREAAAAGKTLLVLDTASAEAERVYERRDWQRLGVIPDYGLNPDGSFCDTTV